MRRREDTGVWWASPHVGAMAAFLPTVMAVFVVIHEMTFINVINGVSFPAAGTNFASAVGLSGGQLLYNNSVTSFPLTQPPGISIILLPFTLLGGAGNMGGAVAAARIFTAIVAIANVLLVGLSARRFGLASSFVAGTAMALYPLAFHSTASFMLEPYLVFFCLLSYVAAFSQGFLVHGTRLILAGALMGFAITIKPWAVLPAIGLLIVAAINWREAILRTALGLAGGIIVPCLLFFLTGPGNFIHNVIASELPNGGGSASNIGGSRLNQILGLVPSAGFSPGGSLPLIVALVIGILLLLTVLTNATNSSHQDWVFIGVTVGAALVAFVPNTLPVGYDYFLAAFGAVLIGNIVGRLIGALSSISVGKGDTSSTVASGVTFMAVGAMLASIAIFAPREARFEKAYFMKHASNPSKFIEKVVPANSCVISNSPEALVLAGRFTDLPANCAAFFDADAILRSAGGNASASTPGVVADWERAFSNTKFFVELSNGQRVPWSPQLNSFFVRNFTLVGSTRGVKVWENKLPVGSESS